MEQEFYIPKLGLIPICIRPVRLGPVTDQYDLCWRATVGTYGTYGTYLRYLRYGTVGTYGTLVIVLCSTIA